MASVLLAGSSGFLGSHLCDRLRERGHTVTRLVRRAPQSPDELRWDTRTADTALAQAVESSDVVVNLAGSPTFGNPHSQRWSSALRESRVTTTATLARAVAGVPTSSRPAFLAGNAVGWYGDHAATPVTEASDTRGHTLMSSVCREWQAAADPAVRSGARVAFLRTSPVLDAGSAPLQQLVPLFRLGLGARVGSGRQYFPVVSLRDWLGGVLHVLENDLEGPVNLTAPVTPTNAEFTQSLARAVHRPAFLAVPAPVIQVGAGRLSPELLGSVNARPAALERSGYAFADPDVDSILAAALGDRRS